MGSSPSKKQAAVPERKNPNAKHAASSDKKSAGSALQDTVKAKTDAGSIFERKTTAISDVKASMIAIAQSDSLEDQDTTTNLNNIIKIYYELSRLDMAKLKEACNVMLQHGLLDYFVKMWDTFHENPEEFYSDVQSSKFNNFNRLKVIFWNYSDKCENLCEACYKNREVVARLMKEFTMPELAIEKLANQRIRHMMKANLGILHNTVRHCDKTRELIRLDNGVEKILAYNKSTYLIIKAKVFIVLAYCVDEDENEKLMTGSGVISFIVKLLNSAVESPDHVAKMYAFSAEETVAALNKLASNDENKKKIVEAGVLPLLNKLLDIESCSPEEHLQAVNCIWALAFHPDNKDVIINEPGLIDAVKALRSNEKSLTRLKKACSSLLFVLNLEEPSIAEQGGKQLSNKHIMISYNWDVQQLMFMLRDFLKQNGFDVWMDVDRIQDSILSAMADAVENAAVVVIAMTEAYKNSNSCRTEAEYTYKRGVPILPLLLQPGYIANGWLGAMVGTKLYVNLSAGYDNEKFVEIRNQLTSLSSAAEKVTSPVTQTSNTALPIAEPSATIQAVQPFYSNPGTVSRFTSVDHGNYSLVQARISCTHWKMEQVKEWCKKIGMKRDNGVVESFHGSELAQLCKVLIRSPDTYYKLLREDMHMDMKDAMAFTSAIEELLSS